MCLLKYCVHFIVFIYLYYCKGVGCASGVGLPTAALSPSFLDKRVGTGPVSA